MARPVVCGNLSLRMLDKSMGVKAAASAAYSARTRGRGSRAPLMVPKSILGPRKWRASHNEDEHQTFCCSPGVGHD